MKIYDKYLELKNLNKNKLYLFKSGNFYIFLADDADKINEYMVLKKTPYNKEIMKCGFPVNSVDSYMKVFNNHKLDIEVNSVAIVEPPELKALNLFLKFQPSFIILTNVGIDFSSTVA